MPTVTGRLRRCHRWCSDRSNCRLCTLDSEKNLCSAPQTEEKGRAAAMNSRSCSLSCGEVCLYSATPTLEGYLRTYPNTRSQGGKALSYAKFELDVPLVKPNAERALQELRRD
jgi:hypothetical protein